MPSATSCWIQVAKTNSYEPMPCPNPSSTRRSYDGELIIYAISQVPSMHTIIIYAHYLVQSQTKKTWKQT